MKIYRYLNKNYYSVEDCLKNLPKLSSLPNIKMLTDESLAKLGIKVSIIDNEKSQEIIKLRSKEVRKYRNELLKNTDKYMLRDYPIEQLDLDSVISYRQYLRDYTANKDWWKSIPKTLNEFISYDSDLYE
jgi:hypothetical protein